MIKNLQPEEIFDSYIPVLINENPDVIKKIRSVIGFTLKGEGCNQSWTIDLLNNPGVRPGIDDMTKCQISINKNIFMNLLQQEKIKPWLDAYKSKDIVVKGHLPTIIKLERLAGKLVKEKTEDN
jgi:hypothetical protein